MHRLELLELLVLATRAKVRFNRSDGGGGIERENDLLGRGSQVQGQGTITRDIDRKVLLRFRLEFVLRERFVGILSHRQGGEPQAHKSLHY